MTLRTFFILSAVFIRQTIHTLSAATETGATLGNAPFKIFIFDNAQSKLGIAYAFLLVLLPAFVRAEIETSAIPAGKPLLALFHPRPSKASIFVERA